MSMTVEALTDAISQTHNWCALTATAQAKCLLPFIERHIAENKALRNLYTTLCEHGYWEGGFFHYTGGAIWLGDTLRDIEAIATPKPDGAVPLPETFDIRDVQGVTLEQCEAYGDAREAAASDAGRADAVPKWVESLRHEVLMSAIKASFTLTRDELAFLLAPIPGFLPRQPAAEGERLGSGGRYWRERAEFWRAQAVTLGWHDKRDAENGEHAAVNQQMTTQGEGAGREAVATVSEDNGGGSSLNWTRGAFAFYRDHPPGTKIYTHPSPVADAEIEAWMHPDSGLIITDTDKTMRIANWKTHGDCWASDAAAAESYTIPLVRGPQP